MGFNFKINKSYIISEIDNYPGGILILIFAIGFSILGKDEIISPLNYISFSYFFSIIILVLLYYIGLQTFFVSKELFIDKTSNSYSYIKKIRFFKEIVKEKGSISNFDYLVLRRTKVGFLEDYYPDFYEIVIVKKEGSIVKIPVYMKGFYFRANFKEVIDNLILLSGSLNLPFKLVINERTKDKILSSYPNLAKSKMNLERNKN